MRERIYNLALNYPVLVLITGLLLVGLAASGAKNLVFKSDYRVFFSDENPQLTAFEDMQKIYSKSDNVAFIIAPKSGTVFEPELLSSIYDLTEESWQIPYSTRVDSITNYQNTTAEEDDLLVEDLVLYPEALTAEQMDGKKAIATGEPLLVNKLVSPEGHVTVVSATIQLPGINPVTEVPEVMEKVRAMRDSFLEQNNDVEVHLSGMVAMNSAFAEASLNDNATLVPLMFGVVILSMVFLLKTFSGTIATLVVVITSIAAAMGLAGWAGIFLTGPSAGAPTMILTLAVADCVHILTTFFYEMRQGVEKRKALADSLRINFRPIMLTSLTTAIGFLSMNFSDSPPFGDYSNGDCVKKRIG